MMNKVLKRSWVGFPPWIILGSVVIVILIFIYWTMENIHKQKENMSLLLLEKGAALIRSFEAGARTGMMGMGMMERRGGGFRLQSLLTETAQLPDIVYLIVTDDRGTILAHNDPTKIGGTYGKNLDLERIARSKGVQWRQVTNPDGTDTFEVFRRFSPTQAPVPGQHRMMMMGNTPQSMNLIQPDAGSNTGQIIFVGLDMGPIEEARKEDTRHTIVMAFTLLLIGFAAIFSLFLAQAYRSTKTSLTRIKAFSDNVVENMPIGLMAIDSDGNVASFNQTAEDVLRLSANDILGIKASDVLPQTLWNLIDELKTGRRVFEKELECPIREGRVIPLDVSVSSLEGDDGIFLGNIILFRDLTEVNTLKREIETTQRLASLGRIAAGIAHEIRNPLSSIKGFATYFRERYRDNPEDQKIAQIMVQEVERLNRVIGQLLEFARPVAVMMKPTPLKMLIQHSLKMVEGQAREKNIAITMNISGEIEDIPVDQDRINQVLLNLYLNAIEAMEAGGTLSVEVATVEDPRGVKIAISDTGVGINKTDIEHIFDPYFTTKQSGTGLGLAIVHKIIESHKGEVKVKSDPGQGTTMTIFLPR